MLVLLKKILEEHVKAPGHEVGGISVVNLGEIV